MQVGLDFLTSMRFADLTKADYVEIGWLVSETPLLDLFGAFAMAVWPFLETIDPIPLTRAYLHLCKKSGRQPGLNTRHLTDPLDPEAAATNAVNAYEVCFH